MNTTIARERKTEVERICKWCMVSERVAEELDKVEVCEYCDHAEGHEWVDL